MKEKPTTRLLKQARALLARRGGWGQGQYSPCPGRYCALGALHVVATGDPRDWLGANGKVVPGARKAFNLLAQVVPGNNIPAWNDASSRKKKDVLAAFDKAIELSVQS